MHLHVADFQPPETTERSFESTRHLLRFHFYITAGGYWQLHSPYNDASESKLNLSDRFSTVFFYPEFEGKLYMPAGRRQFHLSIQISPSLLSTYLGPGLDGLPKDLRDVSEGCDNRGFAHKGPLSQAMSSAIRQVLHCPYAGATKLLFMESKAIELIAHQFAQIQSGDTALHAPVSLRSGDIERIRYAKDILARDLESPPKLSALARAVGTNHCTLNKGFREVYGDTVFGYLRQLRLTEAKRLLEEEGMNVTETALSVGYNSIPSFSRAFSELFGQSPSVYLKNRDNGSSAGPRG
jgi:AraC-like DNA-binding protein